MSEQCPFTFKDIEKAVEKLKKCSAPKPYIFKIGYQTILANSVEEAWVKIKKIWEEHDDA